MLVTKLKASYVFIMKGHSRESKAFLKSKDTKIPGMLCVLVYSIASIISRMFSPIYRPFIKPVWSRLTDFCSDVSSLFAMTLVAILLSTLRRVIGRQFDKSKKEPSSFGIRVMIPLL